MIPQTEKSKISESKISISLVISLVKYTHLKPSYKYPVVPKTEKSGFLSPKSAFSLLNVGI
jgi:hypothetical protein